MKIKRNLKPIDIVLWRSYISYLCEQTKVTHRKFGTLLGRSYGLISYWFRTDDIKSIYKTIYETTQYYAISHGLKTYPEFIGIATKPSVPKIEKVTSNITNPQSPLSIKIIVPPFCNDCRYAEVEKQEHVYCQLFQTHLYSNAKGDILKAEKCVKE